MNFTILLQLWLLKLRIHYRLLLSRLTIYQPMESSGLNCRVLKRGRTYTRGLLPLATMGEYRVIKKTVYDTGKEFKSRSREKKKIFCKLRTESTSQWLA